MFNTILIANRSDGPFRAMGGRRELLAVAALLLVGAAQSAAPQPFAVACTGTASFTDNVTGERASRAYELPRQVYVFDEVARRVQRALEPRQEFEDVCFRGGVIDSVSFLPGLISVRSEQAGRMCDFSVDRRTGEAEFFSHQDLPGGRYNQIEFRMTCSPTEVPVFDRSRNRF